MADIIGLDLGELKWLGEVALVPGSGRGPG